jgi:hypothetical protein
MGTKSREAVYSASVRHSAEQATEAAGSRITSPCVAWSQRMLAFQEPAQPSPTWPPSDRLAEKAAGPFVQIDHINKKSRK